MVSGSLKVGQSLKGFGSPCSGFSSGYEIIHLLSIFCSEGTVSYGFFDYHSSLASQSVKKIGEHSAGPHDESP